MDDKHIKLMFALSLAMQLGFAVLLSICTFFFLGLTLDKRFHTTPFFLIVGVLIGIATAIYLVYYLINPVIRQKDKK